MNDSLIGSHIAGYRVERLLGRGGMASVYFAWDTQNNRPVALKVMDERYRDTPSYVDRFIHEAQTIASWNQPNIVNVYEAGEEGGIYYYSMEFIRGLDLSQLEKQYLDASQLMPYKDVVRIGWAVADALDFAHARGIIHRDVKPSNVLISVDGRVVLTDFGLVMDINRGTLGETFGSPAYIAPEQARNSANAVPQSDNYALGVMLYEMLTGMVPFHDSSPTALALKHLTEEPPAPRAINPRLSPAVEAVLLRALRKRPEERYATGREMLMALERALGDELRRPEAAVPQPTTGDTQVFLTQRAQPPGTRNTPSPAAPPPVPPAPIPGAATSMRDYSYPQQPGNTSVMPQGGGAPASTSVYAGQPRVYPAQSIANQPPPPYQGSYGEPSYGAPPAPPRRRSRGLGCLAAVGAMLLLVVFAGAAYSAFGPNLQGLLGLPGSVPQAAAPTNTGVPPTDAPTETPQPTDQPTFTPIPPSPTSPPPTETVAPTSTPTPNPTATTVPPTATLPPPTPTNTPTPVYGLTLYRQKTDGLILENTGETAMPVAALGVYDRENKLLLSGSAWEIETLEPGQCVAIFVRGAKATLPKGVKCDPTGKLLVAGSRFWTQDLAFRYNEQPVATCREGDNACDFDTSPNP